MTHNHQMDFDISQAILKRADFDYLGLIASDTKWRRFQQRYKHRDIDPQQVARMNCPIGLAEVGGKLPVEVAVSVAAEIINTYQTATKRQTEQSLLLVQEQKSEQKLQVKPLDGVPKVKLRPTSQQGIHWQEFKQLLTTD